MCLSARPVDKKLHLVSPPTPPPNIAAHMALVPFNLVGKEKQMFALAVSELNSEQCTMYIHPKCMSLCTYNMQPCPHGAFIKSHSIQPWGV
jgi:hypothetical protein